MKLKLNLIPSTAFYSSLRAVLGPKEWSRLSKAIRGDANHTCVICGAVGSTHLHESWEFNVANHKQILKGFEVVCPECHAVHHWGHSRITGKDMRLLVDYACKINEIDKETFREYVDKCFEEWEELSCYKWILDEESYKKVLEVYGNRI